MKKTLTFTVEIDALPQVVWETMLNADTYRKWTVPFAEGCYFEGTWEVGSRIHFLAPSGDGMVAEIAENRFLEHVSIRHLGEIKGGVEDTTSEAVRAWAPAYENYTFAASGSGTKLTVDLDTLEAWEDYMLETYPKALLILKKLCEASA